MVELEEIGTEEYSMEAINKIEEIFNVKQKEDQETKGKKRMQRKTPA